MKKLQFIVIYSFNSKAIGQTTVTGIDLTINENASAQEVLTAIIEKIAAMEFVRSYELIIVNICKL